MNIYAALVEDNKDPNRVGRIKVRVMSVYETLPVEDIPWASPFKQSDGRSFFVPAIGKLVAVVFPNNNMYTPYYIDAENYNHNLNIRLKDMSDDDYVNFTALVYDHRTQIYSNNEELKLDYYYNNIVIDKGSINIDLKNNNQRINLGDRDTASQQALFGNHWLEWFDKVVNELLNPMSLVGNMGAPIVKTKLDTLLEEYKKIRSTFLSKNIYLVDNGKVENQNEKKRDYDTKSILHDLELKFNGKDILDTRIGINESGYVDIKGNFIKTKTDTNPLKERILDESIEQKRKLDESKDVNLGDMDDNAFLDTLNLQQEGQLDPDYENRRYGSAYQGGQVYEDGTPVTGITIDESQEDSDIYSRASVQETMKSEKQKLQRTNSQAWIDSTIYEYNGSQYTDKKANTDLKTSIPGRNINIRIEDYGLNIDRSYQLSRHKYVESDNPKNKIFLHHTNGNGNPINVFDGWNANSTLVSTPFIIGGYDITSKSFKYNGKIYQFYPENAWSWTSGVGGQKKEKYIVAIELCNYGYVYKKEGKWRTSWNNIIPEDQVYSLADSPYPIKTYNGYTHYQRYFPEQIESLKKLLQYLIKKYNIKIDEGNYANPKYWQSDSTAFNVDTSGIFHHIHTAKGGKWDMHPQPELIQMLNGLRNES
jgi:N-acetyl-anhydromuramyl-L-alanine amidase AmpD